jgi:hypothetical protein
MTEPLDDRIREVSVTTYQMLAVKQGLKACKIGMRVNRAYTPTNLRLMTENFTGKKFKSRDYDGMIAAIEEKLGVS